MTVTTLQLINTSRNPAAWLNTLRDIHALPER